MIVLNSSHPLAAAQVAQAEALAGRKVERVIEVRNAIRDRDT